MATLVELPRLKVRYREVIVPEMMKRLGYKNPHQVARLEKIVINIGVSEAKENIKVLDTATTELAMISGQRPQVRRAKRSLSNFKLRAGMPIGLRVTLRGDRLYEFFDRLTNSALPRVRDFRGLDPEGFDGLGNYNLGLHEQYLFPEVNLEKSDKPRGMNITIVTTTRSDEEARLLLSLLGMPFKKAQEGKE
ncbi:MAG: 50S ribosomal protein L5 [Elusimicrobia bacterium]|nr:50S ribosomal protein L5 [Elusimicrobiota bacterium]